MKIFHKKWEEEKSRSEKLSQQITNLKSQYEKQSETERLKFNLDLEGKEAQIQRLSQIEKELNNKKTELAAESSKLKDQNQELEAQLEKERQQTQEAKESSKLLQQQITSLTEQIQTQKKNEINDKIKSLEQQMEKLRDSHETEIQRLMKEKSAVEEDLLLYKKKNNSESRRTLDFQNVNTEQFKQLGMYEEQLKFEKRNIRIWKKQK